MSKVYILYTGGTIGMMPKDPTNPASPLEARDLESLLVHMPGITDDLRLPLSDRQTIELTCDSFEAPVDSSNVNPSDWQEIAARIQANYDRHDGFVVLHGTDTMAFTASALSFMFENLSKPIIVTGSQLPISASRTDAVLNLSNALHLAGYKATGLPCVPEVTIAFADRLVRGNRARKVSTVDYLGFDSPNLPPLGMIGQNIRLADHLILPPSSQPLAVNPVLDPGVTLITLFPGITDENIISQFGNAATKGYILRTFGMGNIPRNATLLRCIEEAQAAGKLVVNLSQCFSGPVKMGTYDASSDLVSRGVLSGQDMTPEAAITKLMWVLGNQQPGETIERSLRGELD